MTPELQIGIASLADAGRIAAMSRELIEHGLPWTWRSDRVRRAIATSDTNVAVVRTGTGIAAFGIMEVLDVDAHLVLFAVRAASQRQGIGSALLRWLEATARAAGAQRIRLEARRENAPARHFYNEHGYHERVIHARMYSGLADGIRMDKWFRSANDG